jgi:hypothetical protein
VSDQTKIQTVGPEDPNAPTRSKGYALLAVAFPIVGALATFGVLSADQASAITGFATAALGLAGAFGFGFVANKTNKQVHNGTFDEAPPDPVGNVFEQLDILKNQVDRTVSDATSQVTNAAAMIQSAVSAIPGGSLVSGAVFSGPVGDLIQAMSDQNK